MAYVHDVRRCTLCGVEIIDGAEAVPAALYPDFAAIFGMPVQDCAKSCLMFGNPSAYEALFGSLPEDLRAAA